MSNLLVWVLRGLLALCLQLRYPAVRFQKEESVRKDPAYAVYETYRYAYERYGYLFSYAEKTEEKENTASDGTEAVQAATENMLSAASLARLQDYVGLTKNPDEPQILIYHTHASETYADYGPQNTDADVVGAGTYLTELLRQRGWNVIHDTTAYDRKEGKLERSRAYAYALEGVQGILQTHPTIEVVLDLHRDGVADSVRLTENINGKPTAQIMFFQGMSRTPEGEIAYLPNPHLQENLAFCFQMQLACGRYPGFARKIYLKGLRYNLHLRGRSSLIEAGAQTNTKEEVWNAMELLAEVVDTVLDPVTQK